MLRRIVRSSYREQRWKNGGGLTCEVAADFFDEAQTRAAWRISIATIDRDGPFSEFRGYDRTIVAIDGDPVDLRVDDETIRLERFEPLEFSGDSPAAARLAGGAARDLNVRSFRDAYAHDVEIVQGRQRFVLDEDEFAFVVAIDGPLNCNGESCDAGDTLEIDEEETIEVNADGHAAVIRITPL